MPPPITTTSVDAGIAPARPGSSWSGMVGILDRAALRNWAGAPRRHIVRRRGVGKAWHPATASRHGIAVARHRTRREHQIGRAHVCTPVTNEHIVCRLLLE